MTVLTSTSSSPIHWNTWAQVCVTSEGWFEAVTLCLVNLLQPLSMPARTTVYSGSWCPPRALQFLRCLHSLRGARGSLAAVIWYQYQWYQILVRGAVLQRVHKSQQFLEAMTVGWRLVPFISVWKQNMDEHGRQFIWHCILLSHYIAIVWYSGSPNAQTRPAMPFLPPGWRMEGNSAVSQLAVAKVQTPAEAKALRGCHFGWTLERLYAFETAALRRSPDQIQLASQCQTCWRCRAAELSQRKHAQYLEG